MNAVMNWFLMHGYGVYIWSSYGIVVVGLVANLAFITRQGKQSKQCVQRWWMQRLGLRAIDEAKQ